MASKIIEIGYGNVKRVKIGGNGKLVLIGGPCAIENRDHALMMADQISKICDELGVDWVYKSCFDKDCRSSPDSFHGVGIDQGLEILSEVRNEFGIAGMATGADPSDRYILLFCSAEPALYPIPELVSRYAFRQPRRHPQRVPQSGTT